MVICIQWLSKNASISYVREKAIKCTMTLSLILSANHSVITIPETVFDASLWLEIMKRTLSILRSPFYFILSVQGTDSNGSPQ